MGKAKKKAAAKKRPAANRRRAGTSAKKATQTIKSGNRDATGATPAKRGRKTVGGRHQLPAQPTGAERNAALTRRGRGPGALLVWLQDRTGKLHRMVDGIAIVLRGGYIYPLPVRDLTQVQAADGRTIHEPGEDPKGLGFMWDPTATPLTLAELERLSIAELEAHREQLDVQLQRVRMEIDGVSGAGTFDKLYRRGAKRTRLTLPDGTVKRVKRAGAEGSLYEVRRHYFGVVPEAKRSFEVIPALTPPMPDCIEVLEGDPLFCAKCGSVQPSLGELQKHAKLIHEQRANLKPRPGKYTDAMPSGAQVFERQTQFLGEMLEGQAGAAASDE